MSLIPGFMLPQANDASVTYLGQVLGNQVINDLLGSDLAVGASSHIFSRMMEVFNHLLLGGGLLIFAILLFIGTMNSAADGQFLGKKWDSTWTPVRLVFGVLLVVPLNTGYCVGQYIILYAIFLGINLATMVWQEVINDIFNNQDTPPPPTYLTANVQNVLAEALNSVAVPAIVSKAGLVSSGSGGISAIPITATSYTVGSAGLPSNVNEAVMADVSGLCAGLFSAYTSSCQAAVGAVFLGVPNNPPPGSSADPATDTSMTGVVSYAAIGSPSATQAAGPFSNDPWFGYYASGISETPFSSPDGLIWLYGAYVYDTSFLSESTAPTQICSNGTNGGTTNLPSCVLSPTLTEAQGAANANADLNVVVGNAITSPGSKAIPDSTTGLLSDNDAQALLNICSTQQATGNSGTGSVSPCDIQAAIQDIINASQEYAEAMALANAGSGTDPNGPNPPCQSSSTPSAGCSGGSVPPQGQQEAMARNSYKYQATNTYQDVNPNTGTPAVESWHIGYNLNDYWVPDVNNQQYFDLQLNNSWWAAGSSYLVVDNAMSQNMAWMAGAIQKELSIFQQQFSGSEGSGAANPNLKYSCSGHDKTFTPDITGSDLNSFLTAEFCVEYGAQVMEYSSGATTVGGNLVADSTDTNGWTAPCSTYQVSVGTGTQAQTVDYYSCALDRVRASQVISRNAHYGNDDIGVSEWDALIAPYMPPSSNVSTPPAAGSFTIDTSATPMFYQQLQSVPSTLQGPIAVLLALAKNDTTPNPQAGYVKIYPYLVALLGTLQYNGALSQGPVQSSLPVNQAIDFIFNQLIGGHSGIGSASEAQNAAVSVNTVMQQVYNLGLVDPGKTGIVGAQFSVIQQAQTVGISMVMACISSMETVFSTYTATLQNMVDVVNKEVASASGDANWAELASFIPIAGPLLGAKAGIDVRNVGLEIVTTTTTTMTSISVQLMWLPLFMFIMTALFTGGIQFSILVPLMPYILFWGGEIAWLIGVLEAVVAAPLIMLGLAHPGGNEYLGHSAPAVRMLIGVMFRPVLMVIGMVTGIMLTYIVITFSAQGFHIVAAGILNSVPSGDSTVQGIMACLMLFMYGTFLVMAFEKCFSPIYMFPEKVVEYIGGAAAKGGEADLQRMSQASDKAASGAAQAGGDTMNKGLQAKEGQAKGQADIAQKGMDTHFQDSKDTGEAVHKSISEGAGALTTMAKFMV